MRCLMRVLVQNRHRDLLGHMQRIGGLKCRWYGNIMQH